MPTIVKKQITLNGKTYSSEAELPESMRAYFRDDNKNGIPDTMEPLVSAAKAASQNSQDITISSVSSTDLPASPAVYQDSPHPVCRPRKNAQENTSVSGHNLLSGSHLQSFPVVNPLPISRLRLS